MNTRKNESSEKYDFNPSFANWNEFYVELINEVNRIKEVGVSATLDINNKKGFLSLYFSRIFNLLVCNWAYIRETEKIENNLTYVEKVIFSREYIRLVNSNNLDYSSHMKILKILRDCFRNMCVDFSFCGLLPKISKLEKKDPKKAILRGYDS